MIDIKGYEGLYAITEDGQVWSYRTKQFRKPFVNNSGYLQVSLIIHSKVKNFLIHRLVAEAYIPNPNNLPEVNHKDENKLNPHYTNLEWCTHEENINYGTCVQRRSAKLAKPADKC